ncbi:MAG: WYL domain-containing protein [Proteocatella sp.]
MKIDRLIGIITLLLQNEKMTAPDLAVRFEVSRRTINRDIEDICKAGIPIVTIQGINGGVSILENCKIDKTLFTAGDLQAIFTGLSSLDSVSLNRKYQNIIEKFSAHKDNIYASNHILIDLSSHYKNTLAPKIEMLQHSIETATIISFVYFNNNGERQVVLDPHLVIFQWSNWYVLGFDHDKKGFRLYKLNRICDMKQTDQHFEFQEIPKEKLSFSNYFTDEIQAVILFEKSEKYRLIEEYGANNFHEVENEKLCFSFPFTNQNYLLDWILSFGEKAELIEPKELRGLLRLRLKNALKQYSE